MMTMRLLCVFVFFVGPCPVPLSAQGTSSNSSKESISTAGISSGGLLVDHASLEVVYRTHNTAENGPMAFPWISQQPPNLPQRLPPVPICYNQVQEASIVRLSHVLCRQVGFMIASKWVAIPREAVLFVNNMTTGLMAFCRGDEQLVAHCQWQRPVWCSHFLAIECGQCSNSHYLTEDSHVMLFSPGFPVYLPLIACEWNITLLPEHNLIIRFQQFELPSPIYEEAINTVTCVSGSLDVMSWHEDINKMVLDGRFCGRYSPGNLTILSNRVSIRFTSGSYKADVFSRKGFMAELSSSPLMTESSSGSIIIVRWILIGCAILLTIGIVIFLWLCKRKDRLGGLRQRFCRACCPGAEGNISSSLDGEEEHSNPMTSVVLTHDGVRLSRSGPGDLYQRRRQSEIKAPDPGDCDARHWEQTQRLEKWHLQAKHSKISACVGGNVNINNNNNNSVERKTTLAASKDESHVYEEIDCSLNNQLHQQEGIVGTVPTAPPPSPRLTTPPPFSSVVSRNNRINDPPIIIPYLPLIHPAVGPPATLPRRLPSSSSILWPPSYFPPSESSSHSSSSPSELYVNPEPDSTEDDED